MRKTIIFTILLSFLLLFSYCKNEKEKQLNERKLKIDSITNQTKTIFSKSRADIVGYRLDINKDSLQNSLFKCLADSAELGLAFAEKIRDEVLLKVDSVKRLENLYAEKEKADQEKANKLAVKILKSKVSKLFNSLMSFKNTGHFREYGFGVGGKYNYWLREVQSLKSAEGADSFLSECGFFIGELESLGLEYATSGGKETEYSRYTSKIIRDGLKGIKSYE
jgi:hypothetical protein